MDGVVAMWVEVSRKIAPTRAIVTGQRPAKIGQVVRIAPAWTPGFGNGRTPPDGNLTIRRRLDL